MSHKATKSVHILCAAMVHAASHIFNAHAQVACALCLLCHCFTRSGCATHQHSGTSPQCPLGRQDSQPQRTTRAETPRHHSVPPRPPTSPVVGGSAQKLPACLDSQAATNAGASQQYHVPHGPVDALTQLQSSGVDLHTVVAAALRAASGT